MYYSALSHLDASRISRTVDLDDLEIYADPLLEDVFVTIMENALFRGSGVAEVSIHYREEKKSVTILIEDKGCLGFPVEEKERIFEWEYKGRGGPGLFLAREILSITGISIKETGEPDAGARFEIANLTGNTGSVRPPDKNQVEKNPVKKIKACLIELSYSFFLPSERPGSPRCNRLNPIIISIGGSHFWLFCVFVFFPEPERVAFGIHTICHVSHCRHSHVFGEHLASEPFYLFHRVIDRGNPNIIHHPLRGIHPLSEADPHPRRSVEFVVVIR